MACCGAAKPKLDYLITYRDGTTERVPAAQGVITCRQKILKHPSGGGAISMVPPKK